MSKSASVILREKGNSLFCSAGLEGVGNTLKATRLKEAIKLYTEAKQCSCNQDEHVSAAKNIGIAATKLIGLFTERREPPSECRFFCSEAITNLDCAYRLSSCKSNTWVDNLLAKFHETIQMVVDYYSIPELMVFNERLNELESYTPNLDFTVHIRCELHIEIAQLRFNEGVTLLGSKDFKGCLYQIKECYRPIQEARKHGHDVEHVMQEVRIIEADLFLHECICRSHQATAQGDELLEKYIKGEESLNMGMVWTVVDLYKEAVILVRENDPEAEAIALSRLGSIFDKVLKEKYRAKPYMMRSIQLAMSLHPRTFDSEPWFKEARETLDRYQQETVRQEDEVWNKEREEYVKELSEELETLKQNKKEGKSTFLKFIYEKYPPRWKGDCVLPDPLPEEGDGPGEWKPILKNAVIHYHPDKVNVESDGKQWKVMCEEIFKMLSSYYEMMKG